MALPREAVRPGIGGDKVATVQVIELPNGRKVTVAGNLKAVGADVSRTHPIYQPMKTPAPAPAPAPVQQPVPAGPQPLTRMQLPEAVQTKIKMRGCSCGGK